MRGRAKWIVLLAAVVFCGLPANGAHAAEEGEFPSWGSLTAILDDLLSLLGASTEEAASVPEGNSGVPGDPQASEAGYIIEPNG